MLKSLPSDFAIAYNYATGTIAPPYKFKYDISINVKGEGTFNYSPDGVFNTKWTEKFHFSRKTMHLLWKQLNESGFFNTSYSDSKKHPIGGSVESLTIIANGKTYNIPKFPDDRESADKIFAIIKKYIPQKIMDTFTAKKQQLIEDYKKSKD